MNTDNLRNVVIDSSDAEYVAGVVYIRKLSGDPMYRNAVFNATHPEYADDDPDSEKILVPTNLSDDVISGIIEMCRGKNAKPFYSDCTEDTVSVANAMHYISDKTRVIPVYIKQDEYDANELRFSDWIKSFTTEPSVVVSDVSDQFDIDTPVCYLSMNRFVPTNTGDIGVHMIRTNLDPMYLSEVSDYISYGYTVRF